MFIKTKPYFPLVGWRFGWFLILAGVVIGFGYPKLHWWWAGPIMLLGGLLLMKLSKLSQKAMFRGPRKSTKDKMHHLSESALVILTFLIKNSNKFRTEREISKLVGLNKTETRQSLEALVAAGVVVNIFLGDQRDVHMGAMHFCASPEARRHLRAEERRRSAILAKPRGRLSSLAKD